MTSRRPTIVAVDGPAGAGKSTVSKILARRLGFTLVDTGAIYRCVARAAQCKGVSDGDLPALKKLLDEIHIHFQMVGEENRVFLDGADVSLDIRTPDISMAASKISGQSVVRDGLLSLQRRLANQATVGAILEGRDIGTVVFPDADLKVFLHASPDIRARRRFEELFQKGVDGTLGGVLADQKKRDDDDSSRAVAPLKAADDAVLIDSTSMPLSEVVTLIESLVHQRMK